MAKGKSRSRTRDNNSITRSHRRYNFDPDYLTVSLPDLRQIEDRRTWNPSRFARPARTLSGVPHHRLVVPQHPYVTRGRPYKFYNPLPSAVGFKKPETLTICEKRARRRRALFAFKKTGKGGQRRPRYSEFSSVHCKRRK